MADEPQRQGGIEPGPPGEPAASGFRFRAAHAVPEGVLSPDARRRVVEKVESVAAALRRAAGAFDGRASAEASVRSFAEFGGFALSRNPPNSRAILSGRRSRRGVAEQLLLAQRPQRQADDAPGGRSDELWLARLRRLD